jgi:hypothetical protein
VYTLTLCLIASYQDLGSKDNVSVIIVQLAPATEATLPTLQQQQQQQQQSASAASAAMSEHTAQQQLTSYPDMLPPSKKPPRV